MTTDLATFRTNIGNSFDYMCDRMEYTKANGQDVHCCNNALTLKMVCLEARFIPGPIVIDDVNVLGTCDYRTDGNACA